MVWKPDVIAKRLGDTTILVHFPSNTILELNETGSRIWELIGDSLDIREIVDVLVEEFVVERPEALAETLKLIARLEDEKLVIP